MLKWLISRLIPRNLDTLLFLDEEADVGHGNITHKGIRYRYRILVRREK